MNETDKEIARILETRRGYGTPDEWASLARRATDPALKKKCEERWMRAYRAEEYSAGIY